MNINNNKLLNENFLQILLNEKNSSKKQKLINEIYTIFHSKNKYFQNSFKNLTKFFKIMSNLLNENNNNLLSKEINLISLINNKIKTSKNNNNNFINKNLLKIFNKFHLQNEKINKQIIFLFNNLIENNNIKFEILILEIINMKLEQNSNHKNNLILFTVNKINNSNLTIEIIQNSMLNLLKKIFKNSNSNINKISFISIETLNEHSNSEKINLNNENNINFNNINFNIFNINNFNNLNNNNNNNKLNNMNNLNDINNNINNNQNLLNQLNNLQNLQNLQNIVNQQQLLNQQNLLANSLNAQNIYNTPLNFNNQLYNLQQIQNLNQILNSNPQLATQMLQAQQLNNAINTANLLNNSNPLMNSFTAIPNLNNNLLNLTQLQNLSQLPVFNTNQNFINNNNQQTQINYNQNLNQNLNNQNLNNQNLNTQNLNNLNNNLINNNLINNNLINNNLINSNIIKNNFDINNINNNNNVINNNLPQNINNNTTNNVVNNTPDESANKPENDKKNAQAGKGRINRMQKFFGKKHNKEQSSNEILKDNNNITPNANNEPMVNENKPNNFDEQPIGGNKTATNNFDEQPIGGNKTANNNFDEQPIGGNKTANNNFDDQPVGGKSKPPNSFDDQPVGGNKNKPNNFDDQPVGGNKSKPNNFDDQPVGGNKSKPNNFDDQPVGGNKNKPNNFDDQPVGGNKNKPNNFDDQPVGGNKNKPNNFDDQPVGGKSKPPNNFDDQPVGGNKSKPNNFDDQPVGGHKTPNNFDDQPVGGHKSKPNNFDDQPVGGKNKPPNNFDDQPIGGSAAKKPNFEDERPIKGMSQKPTTFDEQPVGGSANKKPTNNFDDQPIKGMKNINNFDDQPVGGSANKKPTNFDDQPIKGMKSNNFDEQPIKGMKSNNFDEQPVGSKQPANNFDEKPIKGMTNNEDRPIKPMKTNENEVKPASNNEDRPIKPPQNEEKPPDSAATEGGDDGLLTISFGPKKKGKKKMPVLSSQKNPPKKYTKKKDENGNPIETPKPEEPPKKPLEDRPIKPPEDRPISSSTPSEQPFDNAPAHNNKESMNEFEKKLALALEQEQQMGGGIKTSAVESKAPAKKEDPKYDNIKSILGPEIVNLLNSTKWEEKKKGFELMNDFINNNSNNKSISTEFLMYLKFKLKDWKETNFNLVKEAMNIYINMLQKKLLDKDYSTQILQFYYEKFSDIKLKESITNLINSMIETFDAETVIKTIISKLMKKNNTKLLTEYSTFFQKIFEEYDISELPIKEAADFCKLMANNSNQGVRNSGTQFLCILYKYIGDEIKMLIKDIKESTLKLIEAELAKVTVIKPNDPNNSKKKKSNKTPGKNKSTGIELFQPVDVSKKINADIQKNLKSGKWPEKKEAAEKIEKILEDAHMKILPNGLNPIIDIFKSKLTDGNKSIVRLVISLIGKFIDALNVNFKQFAKPIALNLIPNLADKMQILRDDVNNLLDKWVEKVGFETIVIYIPQFLKTENADIRTEILKFFDKYKNKFNKNLAENVFKDMENNLLLCLQDRSSSIRASAEDVLKFSLKFVNVDDYLRKIKDFKPAIQKDLKNIIDKISKEIENENENEEEKTNENKTNEKTNEKSNEKSNEKNEKTNEKNEKTNENKNIEKSNEKTPEKNEKSPEKTKSIHKNSDSIDNININNEVKKNEESKPKYKKINSLKQEKTESNEKEKNHIKILKKNRMHQLSNDDVMVNLNNKSTIIKTEKNIDNFDNKLNSNSTILKKKYNKSIEKKKSINNTKNNSNIFIQNAKTQPNKKKRQEKDKTYKFNIENCNKDTINKIKDNFNKNLFNEDFSKKIFSDDFKKIIDAIKEIKIFLEENQNLTIFFDNLDIILKILGQKIYNNQNPSLTKTFFEFLQILINSAKNFKYNFTEIESNILISLLIDKLSISNNTLKETLNEIIRNFIEIIGANKIALYMINIAHTKNSKIKIDVLEIITDLYLNQKIDIVNKHYIKSLSKFVAINDISIRNKIIPLLKEILVKFGDEFWNYIDLNDKDKEFLQNNLYDEVEEEEEENENNSNDSNEEAAENNTNLTHTKNITNSLLSSKVVSVIKGGGKKNQKENFIQSLNESLQGLLSNDLEHKVSCIIDIHDSIHTKYEDYKSQINENINEILKIFIIAMKNLFSNEIQNIPIKFSKYFVIVLCKITTNKELMSHVSYEILYDLSENLLSNLLIENLNKIGTNNNDNNNEGEIIFKSLNSAMLRLLENCNPTEVIICLLDLIKKYRNDSEKNKLSNLAIKCLLKVNQNLKNIINEIKVDKILLEIHLVLIDFEQTQPGLIAKNQTDQMVLRFIKSIISDLVNLKRTKILDDYSNGVKNHEINDKYILKWIKNFLNVINKDNNNDNNNNNINVKNYNSVQNKNNNQHDFTNTMSQLKKKWNDLKKK